MGLKGDLGVPGDPGPAGPRGLPGQKGVKGEAGKSISTPSLLQGPVETTVNTSQTAILKCVADGNPTPRSRGPSWIHRFPLEVTWLPVALWLWRTLNQKTVEFTVVELITCWAASTLQQNWLFNVSITNCFSSYKQIVSIRVKDRGQLNSTLTEYGNLRR